MQFEAEHRLKACMNINSDYKKPKRELDTGMISFNKCNSKEYAEERERCSLTII